MINDHFFAVIMAGGGGTRLWPLSRQARPKQMLRLFNNRTLFEITIDRLRDLFLPDHILVVTVAEQAQQLQQLCPQIPLSNYLIEPMPRGTASVVGLAAVALRHRDPEAVMAILTADHFIKNVPYFVKLLSVARGLAGEKFLVTLGIEPTYPSSGYGYIQYGDLIKTEQGISAYCVLKFKEKPTEDLASQMLAQGNHVWNSGMFIWRQDRILEEVHWHMPDLADKLERISADWESDLQWQTLMQVWPTIEPETIDYGIMEHAQNVAVLSAEELGWSDVGSWDSLFDVLPAGEHGNILMEANHMGIETTRSLICSENTDQLIVTIGVEDLIVVNTDDAILICDKNHAQQVRAIVNLLKQKKESQFL